MRVETIEAKKMRLGAETIKVVSSSARRRLIGL